MSAWIHREIRLQARPRGFHLVTDEILDGLEELSDFETGILHLTLQHTSASLFLTENADPDVRVDLETFFTSAVPDGARHFIHRSEGPDDMPAHVKSALLGTTLSLPVSDGRLALGTWQGLCLGEHRDRGGARRVVAVLQGLRR